MRHLSAAAQTWIVLVVLVGAAALGVAAVQLDSPEFRAEFAQPTVWMLLIGACVAHAFPVIAPRHQAYHATQAFLLASVLVLTWPAVAVIVVAAHGAEWLRRPRPAYIQLYNVATYLIATGAALRVLDALGARPFGDFGNPRTLAIAVFAAALMLLLNHALTASALWLARGIPPSQSGLFGFESIGLDGMLLIVGIAIGGGLQLQPLSILVTGSPLILIYRALHVANVELTSHRDHLTGLYNTRHLEEALELELRRARADVRPTGLAIATLDDVAGIVQRHGRATLDFLVLAIGEKLRLTLREFDVLARLDEGSLGMLLPELDRAQVSAVVRQVGEQLAAQPFGLPTAREPVQITSSFAYASVPVGARAAAGDVLSTVRTAAARAALSGPRAFIEVEVPVQSETVVDVAVAAPPPNGRAHLLPAPPPWTPSRRWLAVFQSIVVLLALALSGYVLATMTLPDLPLAAGVLGLVMLSELLAFELYDRSSFSVSFAPIVAAGLLGGPAATLLAVWSVAVVRGALRHSAWYRIAFNASAYTLTGVPALVIATGAGRFAVNTGQLWPLAIGTAIASSVYYLHTFLVAGAIALDVGADPRQVWARNFRWLFPHYVVLGWMGLGLAVATVELGPLGTALFVAPLLAMRVVLKQYVDRTAGAVHRLEATNADLRAASSLLEQRGEELALLSDLGQLVAAEPRTETLPTLVLERCVPALGEVCLMLWQSRKGVERSVRATADQCAAAVVASLRDHPGLDVAAFAELLDAGDAPSWIAAMGGSWLATPLSGADQRLGWLLAWSATALYGEEQARRLALMREIAQRVALVLERDALLEESAELGALRTINQVKSDFIATTAHELRTPLTSLQGYTELLRGAVPPELRDRWLSIVHVEAAQLGQVVDQLLDVSRLDSGRFQPERREVDLDELVQRVTEHFEQQAALSGHDLVVEMPHPPRVYADPTQIERVLRNLLSNALKYSPGGGHISIAAAETARGEVEICVQDTGLGIPSEWLGRLFERFERVHRPERASIRGIGLGLYIARQLVELNAGRIWVTSDGVGQGAAFHFTVPRVPAHVPQLR